MYHEAEKLASDIWWVYSAPSIIDVRSIAVATCSVEVSVGLWNVNISLFFENIWQSKWQGRRCKILLPSDGARNLVIDQELKEGMEPRSMVFGSIERGE